MDDISWPPNKRSNVKIVPGPRSQPENKKPNIPEVSADNGPGDELPPPVENEEPPVTPPKPSKKHPFIYLKHLDLSKKQWALVITALLILVAAAVFGGWKLYKHFSRTPAQPPQVAAPMPAPEPAPAPTTEASKLTGRQVPIGTNDRPVTGVMIENSPDSRPQAGLKDAGVVVEAIAEGGITRFLALYQESRPDHIGPVRSVRPYYLDYLVPFDAAIAHVGGAPQALAEIRAEGIKDLDQFSNSGSYQRVSNRFAPHNVYTSFDKLDALNAAKGFTKSEFTGFSRKAAGNNNNTPANSISMNISSPLYKVGYNWDGTDQTFYRTLAGQPHRDERSGQTIGANVVIALVVTRGIAGDGQHTEYGVNGAGHAFIFQDGTVQQGEWRKANRKAQLGFFDDAGEAIKLSPGLTWITLVDAKDDVGFKP